MGIWASVGATPIPVMSYAAGGPVSVPAPAERFVLWGQAFGSWGRLNGDGNAASVRRSTGGFTIGGDTLMFDSWRVGLLGGYSNTSFSIGGRSSSGSSDNYHVSIYGGRQFGNLSLRTGAAYTWHDIRTSRSVAFPGFTDSLTANYDARTAQVFGDLGYRVDMGRFAFEHFGSLAYVNLRTEGFKETGGPAALTSKRVTTGGTFTTLGLRASSDFALGSMMATAGGSAFTIAGVPIAQNAAVVEAGLDLKLFQDATFGISYNGQFASNARDQSVKANLAMKF
jgi:subtilase-type serine protease